MSDKKLKNGATEIARIEIDGKRVVMAKREAGYQPYVTWQMDDEGNTFWGHYFETHNEAVADMLARV